MAILTLIVAVVVVSTGPGRSPDPCALLTPTEIQTLASSVKIRAGKASKGALDDAICQYEWGPGGNVQSYSSSPQTHGLKKTN